MSEKFSDNFFKWQPWVAKRISELKKDNRYIEIFFWYSLIIEGLSTILLSEYENIIQGIFSNKNKHILNKYNARTVDEIRQKKLSLGKLNDELCKFLGKDYTLIKRLDKFIKLRNKIIHKIFDIEGGPELLEVTFNKNRNKLMNFFSIIENQQLRILTELYKQNNKILKSKLRKLKNGLPVT